MNRNEDKLITLISNEHRTASLCSVGNNITVPPLTNYSQNKPNKPYVCLCII